MRITVFSTQPFERDYLARAAGLRHRLHGRETPLHAATAGLARDSEAVCLSVNDDASAPVLEHLAALGVKGLAVRGTGTDRVDLTRAAELGLRVGNVPDYGPHAVAELAVGLALALQRHLIEADRRVHRFDFRLQGLEGAGLYGKTAGIAGLGRIGSHLARILYGFGCRLIAFDQTRPHPDPGVPVRFTDLNSLCARADLIFLQLPLTSRTHHLIDTPRVLRMKPGVTLINTGRGGLIDTDAVLAGLASGRIGALGLDVYEHEQDIFFRDHQGRCPDPRLARLLSYPNVLATGHQGFLTHESLTRIAEVTCHHFDCWQRNHPSPHECPPPAAKAPVRHG